MVDTRVVTYTGRYSSGHLIPTLKIQIGRNDPLTMVVLPRNSNNHFLGSSKCG